MKFAIRALALGIAVSGLAASALTAHMGNNSATVNGHGAIMASQVIPAAMPGATCIPNCGLKTGGGK